MGGRGIYDVEYMDYLVKIIEMMPQYGIKCYIDAHQDVYSRHTGGSGAPHWTIGLVGLDLKVSEPCLRARASLNFGQQGLKGTGAAHAHNLHLHPDDPPPKVWPSGYCKLAAATCATVFWAGDTFAPKRRVGRGLHREGLVGGHEGDVGLQAFLQVSENSSCAREYERD